MQKFPKYESLAQAEEGFEAWWLGGGDSSRHSRFYAAATLAATSFGDRRDLDGLLDLVDLHCEHLGWCSEWLPEAEAFLQASLGLATHDYVVDLTKLAAASERTLAIGRAQEKAIVDGKVVNFKMIARAIERLSATLVHRIDALRTMISTEKERWKAEINAPRTKP